jgi:hypothetical protein
MCINIYIFFILNLSLNLSDKSFLQIDSYMWGGDKFKGLYLDEILLSLEKEKKIPCV